MKLPEKGSFGYFDKKKKIMLTATIISFLIVAAIYATGVFIYHTNKSIFTVMAALSVLPAAKVFVSFLVIAGCHSLPEEQMNELSSLAEKNKDNQILYDILLASEEKALIAGTIVIMEEHVLMYSNSKKADAQAVESYIKKILKDCPYASVKMYTDFEQMKKGMQQIKGKRDGKNRYNDTQNNDNENNDNRNNDKIGQHAKIRSKRIKETILIYTI